MKNPNCLLVLLAICLAGCGDKNQPSKVVGKTLAAPILHGAQIQKSLEKGKRAAKQREIDFEKTLNSGR